MDLIRAGGPQHRLPKAVAEGSTVDELGLPLCLPPLEELGPFREWAGRRERIDRHIGPHLPARLPVGMTVTVGGFKEKDLSSPEPGRELLGPGGRGAPRRAGEKEKLFQTGHLIIGEALQSMEAREIQGSRSFSAAWLLRRSTWRSRSTPPDKNSVSPMRFTAASI